MICFGFFSIEQSKVQIPVGPAPMMRTVSFSVISEMRVAQNLCKYVTDKQSLLVTDRVGNAIQSLIGIGTLTYSACPPSMRQPKAHPPLGSVQLLTYPCWQKKHFPQKVSTFTVTLSPGLTDVTPVPTSSTTPTISCPTVVPSIARGTLPCLICRSLVQMLPRVTRTIASRAFRNFRFRFFC